MSCTAWIELAALAALVACHSPSSAGGDASAAGSDAPGDSTGSACTDPGVSGCACAPLTPGSPLGTLAAGATVKKLVADPTRCLVYGLADNAIVVFDTRAKQRLASIAYSGAGYDFDVDRHGARMVVSVRGTTDGSIVVIDLAQRQVIATYHVTEPPGPIELAASGTAYYTNFDQFSTLHALDTATGTDAISRMQIAYQADLDLSPDDARLYVGDSGLSDCAMTAYDPVTLATLGRTHWDANFDFENATRHVFASRAGDVFFARHQWRGDDLGFITGGTHDEDILAESDDGSIAVGTAHTFDAALAEPIGVLPSGTVASAATFAANGQELWYYDGGIRYIATADLAGTRPLGVREVAPLPLAQYTLDQLVYDGTRGLLYARDSGHDAVIAIDAATLAPIKEIRIGTAPSDLALDPTGQALYAGHGEMESIAKIDLATLSFDRFAATPRLPYEIEPAGAGRLIVADARFDGAPTLFDVATGNAAPTTQDINFVALATSGDGTRLFAGGGDVYEFAIGSTSLSLLRKTTSGVSSAYRVAVARPDGSSVFYSGAAFDAATLTNQFTTAGPVIAVSPDGRFAFTATSVVDAATGAVLGTLPVTAQAIAVGSDTAYLASGGAIAKLSLASF